MRDVRSSTIRRAASSMTATADLLSAPRIVPAALRTIPSSTTGSIAAVGRDGVEVRAEEERRPPITASGQAAEHVPHRRADRRARVVLVPLEPDSVELREHQVGDGALLARRARDRGQLEEELEDVRFSHPLGACCLDGRRARETATRSSAAPDEFRGTAAPAVSAAT